jgi:hypothetical protein
MGKLSRREFLAGTTAATAAVALAAPYVQAQKRGGTLRVMPHADLKSVDPIWPRAAGTSSRPGGSLPTP